MATIYTITCHEVYNHGASLQEYALLDYLNSNGHDAKAIHYKPDYLSASGNLKAISKRFDKWGLRNLYYFLKRNEIAEKRKRIEAFDAFAIQYIPTLSTLYKTNEDLVENTPEAEAYICGSDQIWNSFFENGKDPAFYLDFVPDNKRKIAYAASFAIDKIEPSLEAFVKEKVKRIQYVGVRETSGVRILQDLGIDGTVQVLDPTFLVAPADWTSRFVEKPTNDEPYVFIYDFDSNPVIEEIALALKAKYNWKIKTVNANLAYADEVFWTDGPTKFLSLVMHSQMVLSNSFHALAFSLQFNKQFAIINRKDKINTRMRDLLQLIDLEERLISSKADFDALTTIDYTNVQPVLDQHIARSKAFLDQALTN